MLAEEAGTTITSLAMVQVLENYVLSFSTTALGRMTNETPLLHLQAVLKISIEFI